MRAAALRYYSPSQIANLVFLRLYIHFLRYIKEHVQKKKIVVVCLGLKAFDNSGQPITGRQLWTCACVSALFISLIGSPEPISRGKKTIYNHRTKNGRQGCRRNT